MIATTVVVYNHVSFSIPMRVYAHVLMICRVVAGSESREEIKQMFIDNSFLTSLMCHVGSQVCVWVYLFVTSAALLHQHQCYFAVLCYIYGVYNNDQFDIKYEK